MADACFMTSFLAGPFSSIFKTASCLRISVCLLSFGLRAELNSSTVVIILNLLVDCTLTFEGSAGCEMTLHFGRWTSLFQNFVTGKKKGTNRKSFATVRAGDSCYFLCARGLIP